MKTRFSTLDIIAILPELKSKICSGWRVNQVYDCDQKTYLLKLNKSIVKMKKDDDPVSVDEETANKMTLIIESGLRMHTTDYDWPKSHAPSHFATKLRKSIRNKRIENISQVGIDRLVDIQFGSSHAANHLIVELYDKGNLVLTDNEYRILTILRWRKPTERTGSSIQNPDASDDSENFRVGQLYPLERSRRHEDLEPMTSERISELLHNAKTILSSSTNRKKRNTFKKSENEGFIEINLKDLFNPYVVYGSSLLEDKLLKYLSRDGVEAKKCIARIPTDITGRLDQSVVEEYTNLIRGALEEADTVLKEVKERTRSPGYLIQKRQSSDVAKTKQDKSNRDEKNESLTTNIDFFPILSCAERKVQLEQGDLSIQEYESFDRAVDVYYCNFESQKLDTKAFVAEKEARKKLDNLKISQEKRLEDLAKVQREDEERARLIELNSDKVESALLIIRSMLANQIPWAEIYKTIQQAQTMKDPIACLITGVKFDKNQFTMKLSDPYGAESENENNKSSATGNKFKTVEIDIGLSAYANARKFFVKRRTAVNKEKKTIEVSKKALKNVEKQTKEMLKEVVVKTNITKARKRYWFENFFWFISSDGYLIVAGRDAEQNELLVKRYMKNNDIYVHADLHGASSVIIKNELSSPIPPKTLEEAGTMAVCYSSAWDSKIATSSYWVYPKQVSKTAPAGEYLTLGAFIIRGKKNFLPLSNLVLGFGLLFRLGDESIERHREKRLAREANEVKQERGSTSGCDRQNGISDESEAEVCEDDNADGQNSSDDEKNSLALAEEDTAAKNFDHSDEISEAGSPVEEDEGVDDGDDEDEKSVDNRLIDTLTESPESDDILLYAIPMCGPYSAFSSFKYKAKVIPGANKRGKAAKACLGAFMHDKKATQREKDLLRALRDQDFARNIPNKVKLSAVNMKTITKRRPKKSEVRLPIS